MPKLVRVDCRVDAPPVDEETLIVAVDVIRATTTAVTAVAAGRRCFPVETLEHVLPLAQRLGPCLLVGEQKGELPEGFDLNNSPAAVAARTDVERPIVMLSTSGTRLIRSAGRRGPVQIACLRNVTAQARGVLGRDDVALVGLSSDGDFREEDQLCCARIAALLVEAGYEPDVQAREVIDRWGGAPSDAFVEGKSVAYLRRTGQLADLQFILEHVDDLDSTYSLRGDEIVKDMPGGQPPSGR